jgi:hypothetical protein
MVSDHVQAASKAQKACETWLFRLFGNGEGGIRTHGGLRLAGFQDRSHQPLDHLSRGPAGLCRTGSIIS